MSPFTLAYLAQLEVWGLAAVLLQGLLVMASWRAWDTASARGSAAIRHRLACAHFAALAILPAVTIAILHLSVAGASGELAPDPPVAASAPLSAGYRWALQLAAPLAALWLAGAAGMVLRLVLEVRRIARRRHDPAPVGLVASVHRLAAGWIGANLPDVRTADVPAPQIVGLWRPVLVAPRDFARRLPAAEQDAVLLHELAHVWRGDFGWNLLQCFLLSLLWFHPAAWTLYAGVSRERESCCDALAVRRGASATALARALVRLAETQAVPGLAMAIARPSELTARVQRLLHPPGACAAPSSGRRTTVAVGVSVICLIATWTGGLARTDPSMADLCNASALGPTVSILASDASGSFRLRVRQGKVIGATVGAQPLPRDRIRQNGERVTLVGLPRQPILALIITPQDRIRWTPRT